MIINNENDNTLYSAGNRFIIIFSILEVKYLVGIV